MKEKESFKKQFIDANRVDLENRIVPSLAFIGLLISFIGFFVNLFIHLKYEVTLVAVVSFFSYLLIYLISKKKKNRPISKWLLLIFTMIVSNALWYYNFGSHGPAPYLFIIIYSFFIFIFKRNEAVILSLIAGINLIFLFILEYSNPDIVGNYLADKDRILDVFTALLYYGLVFYVFLSIVRRAYYTEYQKAKESDQLKSSFLANMSHEIRTPLNAIVGFSNLLGNEDMDESERQSYVSIINASNESLLRLIDDILDVSLMETNQLKLVYNNCDLKKMMSELESTYRLKLEELHKPNLNVKIEKPLTPMVVHTDCERLRQVMVNLLDNAIKYTEKGSVEFAYEMEGKELRFYVKDTGMGVPECHQKHLFDRFYKVEGNTDKLFRGTGIGLYLCKSIVELLGGNIGVISEINKGSEFYFYLPAEQVIQEESQLVPSPKLREHKRNKKKMKVLVVEDQLSTRQYYDAILKASEFELIHAVNGLDGLEKFKANSDIDLILMDIKMPEMDGFEALKEIRKLDAMVPVFALTAYAMASDKERCVEAGFDAYFSKPLNKSLLLKKIDQIAEVNKS